MARESPISPLHQLHVGKVYSGSNFTSLGLSIFSSLHILESQKEALYLMVGSYCEDGVSSQAREMNCDDL